MARGGKRDNAGRPPGTPNAATAATKAALSELAAGHVEAAMTALADIAANGQSEAARVSAAIAILDRAYGRPKTVPLMAPVMGIPESPFDGLLGNW